MTKQNLTPEFAAMLQSVNRPCSEHAYAPDATGRADCGACRRETRQIQFDMLPAGARRNPAPRFPWWYERQTTRWPDSHYAYGSQGPWGESHAASGKLGDCRACWNARLSNWIAASAVSTSREQVAA